MQETNEKLKRIIWVASYPKSGNTWMRFLLANLFFGPEDGGPLPTRELGREIPGDVNAALWELGTGTTAADLSYEEQHAKRRELHKFFCKQPRNMFVKTHAALLNENGYWHISPDLTEAAIVVVRDPREVAVSMMNHFGLDADAAIKLLNNKNNSLASKDGKAWTRTSDWSVNVASWATLGERTFYCRYEDLHQSAPRCLRLICKFLNLTVDEALIGRAVRHSDFKYLQAEEDAGNFLEAEGKGERFFHHGKMSRWMGILTPDQVRAIEDAHGAVMERFGYLRSSARVELPN